MKIYLKPTIFVLCGFFIFFTITSCYQREEYHPALYTKAELQHIYEENQVLFEDVVEIITASERFYNEGRINEYTDADIISPYDECMQLFNNEDRKILEKFFEFKPYMILYDCWQRFVSFTFINEGQDNSYTYVFWTMDGPNSKTELESYKARIAQNSIIENITTECFMYYCT